MAQKWTVADLKKRSERLYQEVCALKPQIEALNKSRKKGEKSLVEFERKYKDFLAKMEAS